MSPRPTLVTFAAILALAACGQESVQQAQRAASAGIAEAGGALSGAKADASAAVAELKDKAGGLLSQAKELETTVRDASGALGTTLGGLSGAAQDAKTTARWALLLGRVGDYPSDIGLFDDSAISGDLKALLGEDFATFKDYMGVSGPLSRDRALRMLYVTGNKPHRGGDANAYLLIDVENRRLEAGLLTRGKLEVYASPGEPLGKPKEVQTHIANAQSR